MRDFNGKLAVITGAGTGMGRELARQLVAEGASIALCDVIVSTMTETVSICEGAAQQGCKVSSYECDVSNEQQVLAWSEHVRKIHETDSIDLLFNNAGIGGGGSIVNAEERADWDRTFSICWNGVYYCTRAFMPMLLASRDSHLVNTSSVNGFWATVGNLPHSSYSAAKFAVKGFSEALLTDLRLNAPHVKVSVVMPGHIGTSIAINSAQVLGHPEPLQMSDEEVELVKEQARVQLEGMGIPVDTLSADDIRQILHQRGIDFKENAPTSAEKAAGIILDGVREERWRILVGDDAHSLDDMVRATPEDAYTPKFLEKVREVNGWNLDGALGAPQD